MRHAQAGREVDMQSSIVEYILPLQLLRFLKDTVIIINLESSTFKMLTVIFHNYS